jgi:pyrroline-5-carboxylate reductase
MLKEKVGFIGCGNMAEAILSGVLNSGLLPAENIYASDVRKDRLEAIRNRFKIRITNNNKELSTFSDIIILAVKPQNLNEVLEEIKGEIKENKLVVSIAAGIPIKRIQAFLPEKKIVRVMPNTPVLVNAGISGICANSNVTEQDEEKVLKIFESVGKAIRVPERLMDALTAISGSGPAYVSLFIESLIDAGVEAGLPWDIATQLVLSTVEGTVRLIEETGHHPAIIRSKVTSPGGVTACGIHVMEEKGLRSSILGGVIAAFEKSKSLSME